MYISCVYIHMYSCTRKHSTSMKIRNIHTRNKNLHFFKHERTHTSHTHTHILEKERLGAQIFPAVNKYENTLNSYAHPRIYMKPNMKMHTPHTHAHTHIRQRKTRTQIRQRERVFLSVWCVCVRVCQVCV